jgi:AcrR family transcriptional regulator
MTMPRNGRRAEADRNDGRILHAAREVFMADPGAPISAVAARAKVGISALYRRYDGKEGLLRALAADGLQRYIADLEWALAEDGDAWAVYTEFLARVVEGGSQALAQRLAGTFAPTTDTTSLARRAGRLSDQLFARTAKSGAIRDDVTASDVTVLLEMIMEVRLPGPEDGIGLRRRYLALVSDSLRAGRHDPLPSPPPEPAVLARRWRTAKPRSNP